MNWILELSTTSSNYIDCEWPAQRIYNNDLDFSYLNSLLYGTTGTWHFPHEKDFCGVKKCSSHEWYNIYSDWSRIRFSVVRFPVFYFYNVTSGLVTLFQIVCTRRVTLFVLNQGLRRYKVLTKYDSFHFWSYVLGLQMVWETILSIGYVSLGEFFSSISISGIKFIELTWHNWLQ